MTLDDFLINQKLTNASFAARVGVNATTILRIRKGLIEPRPDVMRRIARATDRAVMPNDFVLGCGAPPAPSDQGCAV